MTADKKIKALKGRQSKNIDAAVKKNAKLDKKILALGFKKLQTRIQSDKPWQPKVGDLIYIPTSMYLGHGADDTAGGLATIKSIQDDSKGTVNSVFVTVNEIPGNSYNWVILLENQKEDMEQYGSEIAHPDPDLRPEFNDNGFGDDWR